MIKALLSYLSPLGTIYRARAPQNARPPYQVLTIVSEAPDQDELCASGMTLFTVQLDIYAANAAEADPLKAAAVAMLNRPGDTFDLGSWHVANLRLTSAEDNTELEYTGSDATLTRVTLEAEIHAEEME